MPLLDHFRPPLAPRRHGESFHVNWAGAIADVLNDELLPEGFFAEEHAKLGTSVEIDLAAFDDRPAGGSATATLPRVWTPPAPTAVVPAAFPDEISVFVFRDEGGAELVAAVELVSPANKDREAHRRAFAVKCAAYLARGVGLIVIDVVTTCTANLHAEVLRMIGCDPDAAGNVAGPLYAAAYRPRPAERAHRIVGRAIGAGGGVADAAAKSGGRGVRAGRFGSDLHVGAAAPALGLKACLGF